MAIVRIPAAALLPVHQANAMTGEAPFWDERDGTLWWIDIQGQRLLAFSPNNGQQRDWSLPQMPGMVAGRASGGLILGLEDGLYPFDPVHGVGEQLIAVETEGGRTRVNDGKPDRRGRLWFGSMDKTGSGQPNGALYQLGLDGRVVRLRGDVRIPNAICFSLDGRTAYFSDSRTGIVEAISYDPATGAVGASRPFVKFAEGEHPDGACVDSDGCVWIAVVGGSRVERRRPDGELDTIVELPVSRPTMPMLGGADGKTLFVTSQRRFLSAEGLRAEPFAGDLLAVRVDATAGAATLAAEPVAS
jgi:sugar lactone lactonase YvrE